MAELIAPPNKTLPETSAATQTTPSIRPRPRVWPGLLVLAILAFSFTVPEAIAPRSMVHFMGLFFGFLLALVGVVVWWGLFSRTRWYDRLTVLAIFGGVAVAIGSITNPMAVLLYAFPAASVLWVGWLVISGSMAWPARRAIMMGLIVVGLSWLGLFRVKSVSGDMVPDLRWRWSKTSEELLIQEMASRPKFDGAKLPDSGAQPGDWPEFRGPARDGKAVGVRIRTDWDANPPKQLWKHRVGLGWSSVAVVGGRLYTQEQRLNEECVVCYDVDSGAEIWKAAVAVRFLDQVGGDGPRGTPTVRDGRVYAQGATGKLVCLDAATGKSIWTRDIGTDSGAKAPPMWGYSGSPLVIDDLVIAVPAAPDNKGTIAYRKSDGEPVWTAGEAMHTYSSPQEATFFGSKQILVVSDYGLESFNPADGKTLWKQAVTIRGMNRVVQPNVVGEGDVLLATGSGKGLGTLLIKARKSGDSWTTETGWNSPRLKPYYNDFVTHGGYAYGFDDAIFTCISLADGKAKWKAGRYGHGQVLLLEEQGKLLVVTDTGKVVLLDCNPEEHTELGSFQAVDGKTWNHPVVVRGKLFVRNDEEMACFDIAAAPAQGAK